MRIPELEASEGDAEPSSAANLARAETTLRTDGFVARRGVVDHANLDSSHGPLPSPNTGSDRPICNPSDHQSHDAPGQGYMAPEVDDSHGDAE